MSLTILCQKCDTEIEVDSGDLPDRAYDDFEIECENCGNIFKAVWYPEITYSEIAP